MMYFLSAGKRKVGVIVGIVVPGILLALIFLALFYYWYKKSDREEREEHELQPQ